MHILGMVMGAGSVVIGLAAAGAALFNDDVAPASCIFAGTVGLGMALIAWAMI